MVSKGFQSGAGFRPSTVSPHPEGLIQIGTTCPVQTWTPRGAMGGGLSMGKPRIGANRGVTPPLPTSPPIDFHLVKSPGKKSSSDKFLLKPTRKQMEVELHELNHLQRGSIRTHRFSASPPLVGSRPGRLCQRYPQGRSACSSKLFGP